MTLRRLIFAAALALLAVPFAGPAAAQTPTPQTYSLEVVRNGPGQVQSTPNGIKCPGTCSMKRTRGTEVRLTAAPTTGTHVVWSGEPSCAARQLTCTVRLDRSRVVTATFVVEPIKLEVQNSGGGSVRTDPAGISCLGNNRCTGSFPAGSTVKLIAEAGPGHQFDGWGGGCSGKTATCQLRLGQLGRVASVSSTFSRMEVTLEVLMGVGGKVTSVPPGIACREACKATFDAPTAITLTAVAHPGWRFSGWSGAACTGSAPTCKVQLQRNASVSAGFSRLDTVTLRVQASGEGIVASDQGTDIHGSALGCPGGSCSKTVVRGTRASFVPAAKSGWRFARWIGDVACPSTTCALTVDRDRTVTAVFVPKPAATATTTTTTATTPTTLPQSTTIALSGPISTVCDPSTTPCAFDSSGAGTVNGRTGDYTVSIRSTPAAGGCGNATGTVTVSSSAGSGTGTLQLRLCRSGVTAAVTGTATFTGTLAGQGSVRGSITPLSFSIEVSLTRS